MSQFFLHCDADWQGYRSAVNHADLQKLELLGTDYIFDLYREYMEELNYRVYITDVFGGLLKAFSKAEIPRFYDLIRPEKNEIQEKTPEEIISETAKKIGIIL